MKSEIKTQNISTKKLKFVAEIFLADLRHYYKKKCKNCEDVKIKWFSEYRNIFLMKNNAVN